MANVHFLKTAEPIERRITRQRDALLALSQLQLSSCESLPELLRQILGVAAGALRVPRVSIWRFSADRQAIECVVLYDGATGKYEHAGALAAADFPRYFEAMTSSDVIAVDDAEADPRTAEFTLSYLRPLRIKSMMDAPIHLDAGAVGVLCHEQTETVRHWTQDEKSFAIAVSNVIALAFERCERSRAESTLTLQAAALNAASHAIVIADLDARIVWTNPAFTALTGYTQSEAIGQKPGQLLKSGAHDDAFYQSMWGTLREGRQWRGEMTNRRKDGTTYEEDLTITPVVDVSGRVTHFVGIKVDLTEPHRVARQFLQAQKMEVVGRLAGGVAHDFNNLLTVINGTTELALVDRDAEDPLRQDLERVLEAGERAAALTKQLLAFSRHEIAVREALDAGTMIRDLRRMLVRLIGEDISVSLEIADGAMVLVDRSQFEQVILNLVVNARDAMPRGGTLQLSVTTTSVDAIVPTRPCSLSPGRYARIAVSDSGVGMTTETMARIFEPFFTTKDAGTGTGLGLATVYSIVEQCGGAIIVESAVGTGTTFQILLPYAAEVAAAARAVRGNVSAGTETLLLVEDDDAVRAVTAHMLRTAGYSVLDSTDASSALQVVSDPAERIDLVVTDVVLPGMGGRDLAAQIALTRPGLPVLFTSGYTDDHELARGVRDNAAYFIGKPYSAAGLAGKVRGILDRVVEQRSA